MTFAGLATATSRAIGSPYAFVLAVVLTVLWLITGPFFQYNEAWNFWANTTTTVATFLIVFLIQNSQNRDTKAVQLKLDELIRVNAAARNSLIGIEAVEP